MTEGPSLPPAFPALSAVNPLAEIVGMVLAGQTSIVPPADGRSSFPPDPTPLSRRFVSLARRRRMRFPVLLSAFVLPSTLGAQGPAPARPGWTALEWMTLKIADWPAISPDGRAVA